MTLLFGILFLLSGIINFAFTIMILRELAAETKGLSFFDLRWYVLKNLNNYKTMTCRDMARWASPTTDTWLPWPL